MLFIGIWWVYIRLSAAKVKKFSADSTPRIK